MAGEGFDAEQVAAEAVRRGEDPIAALVGALAGAASVCWESPEGAGVFDSERAAAITDDVVGWLRRHRVVAPLRAQDRVLIWLHRHEDMEVTTDAVRAFLSGAGTDRVMVVDSERVEVAVFDGEEPPRVTLQEREGGW